MIESTNRYINLFKKLYRESIEQWSHCFKDYAGMGPDPGLHHRRSFYLEPIEIHDEKSI